MTTRTNTEWLSALRETGQSQESAVKELRQLLHRAIFSFLSRKGATSAAGPSYDQDDLAEDCAQESVLLIQSKLDQFRGDSQFTTWAYSIAIRVTLNELRRRRWRTSAIEAARLGDAMPHWPIDNPGPERNLEQQQAWAILTELIETALTPLQRKALIAHAFQEMPLDLVAEWLGTNRNSLYKLIHDARKRLQAALLSRGVTHRELIAIFDTPRPERPYLEDGKKSFFTASND
ncbi:RNA polymerase sigma factor [Methylocystis echinoides]|uniref:DNA-directed RNA polymerase sigma-70 factor n=1 Tax=Methylocystis echinoides TaxID=29468 RepID=A0A9W6LUC1_9HYPH|nr:RNA polymerase sigma factor [Methylocystis echinoides]GLI95660.1 DNA-directed RNA polymerase sigma-70 factor [Methylocystis echinoides]